MSLGLLKEKFGHSAHPGAEKAKKADNKLLKEKFSHSAIPDERKTDNREKLHERLNVMTERVPAGDIKSIKDHHREQMDDKQRTIDSLEIAISELANDVVMLKKENTTLLEELNDSKDTKIQTVVEEIERDSSNLIPTLTAVSRQKQGNQKLSWDRWLQIPESKYLFRISENVARKVFEYSNALVDRNAHYRDLDYYHNRYRTRGGDAPAKNYFLSFTGNNADGARGDLVSTQFMPNDPDGSGKHLAESGFTVAYWFRPDETYGDSFHISWKAHNSARFDFGVKDADQPYFGTGASTLVQSWENMLDVSDNDDLKSTFLDDNYKILKDGTWMHIAVTYVGTDNPDGDGNMLRKIYVNGTHIYGGFGETKESVNWTRTGDDLAHGVAFGMRAVTASGTDSETGRSNTKYNNGQACGLDEIAIYKEAKDADWVAAVYDGKTDYNHKDSGGSGLVGYWRFSEGSGTTVEDLSGYGHHGTLTNALHGTAIDSSINSLPPTGTPTWSDMENERRT